MTLTDPAAPIARNNQIVRNNQAMDSGSIRASDADRDQVVQLLQHAYAEGRITFDEHEERTTAALRAKTFDDLEGLTEDLVPRASAALEPQHPSVIATGGANPDDDQITTILSSTKRQGPWRIRRRSITNNVLGDITLDLTEATFEAKTVEINGTHFMSSMVIRVPLGTNVRNETTSVMGEVSIRGIGEPDPSLPTVVLTGTTIMAEIKVRGPKKPPPWRRALT